MANTLYNLLDDDGVLFLVNYMFQKLASSPLTANTTYSISINSSTGVITLTDSDGQTSTVDTLSSSEVQSMIDTAIGQITGISFQIVEDYAHLPVTGENGVIYLVPVSGASTPNVYEEYAWIGEEDPTTHEVTYRYEKIGTTDIDLSGYVQKTDISTMTNLEITSAVNTAYENVWPTPSNNNNG